MLGAACAVLVAVTITPQFVWAGPLTANGTQPLLTHGLITSPTCANCHGDYDPANDLEPFMTWAGTMMANSSRDPLFWAALDVANHDRPGVGDWCLRCHVSRGWLAGRSEPPAGTPDGCQLQGRIDQSGGDFDGVTCHLCHRMMVNPSPPSGQEQLYHENGQYWLDDGDCDGGGEPCRRGPYNYSPNPLLQPPHPWAFSPLHRSSELCALCHNVTNPVANLLRDGVDSGVRFPIERTHKEWSQSDFAAATPQHAECQDCHMPQTSAQPAYPSSLHLNDHAGDFGIHAFAGGNAWVPEVLRREYPGLGIDANFLATRQRALDMLQTKSATVAVALGPFVERDRLANVRVRVTNLAGHKLPTGYPEGRRMWLHVEARDATGALFWESGAYDAITGELAADPPAKVYAVQHGIWNRLGTGSCDTQSAAGQEQFHFVLNDCIASDNRIPPQGFTGSADVETQPVGYLYPETSPGSGVLAHWDDTTYAIPVPAGVVSPISVMATLRYQTTRKAYVQFLADEAAVFAFPLDCLPRAAGLPTLTRGGELFDMWQRHDRSPPVEMAASSAAAVVTQRDAFVCYLSRRSRRPGFAPVRGVELADPLSHGSVELTRAGSVCRPVAVDERAVDNPRVALAGYTTRPRALSRPRTVSVQDAVGTGRFALGSRSMLLVPSTLGPGASPEVGTHAVDPLACYEVRHVAGRSRSSKRTVVRLAEASFAEVTQFHLGRPLRLCVATTRNATPPMHTDGAVVCYAAVPVRGEPRVPAEPEVRVANDIEAAGTADLHRPNEVCLVATIVPP